MDISPTKADHDQLQDRITAPFSFIATNTVRDGMLDDERRRAPGWAVNLAIHVDHRVISNSCMTFREHPVLQVDNWHD